MQQWYLLPRHLPARHATTFEMPRMKRGKGPLSSLSPIAIQVVVAGSETGTQAHEMFAKERQFSTCRRSILDCLASLVCVLRLFEMLSCGATGHAVARVRGGNSIHLLGCHGLRFGRWQVGLTMRLSWFCRFVQSLERWFDMYPLSGSRFKCLTGHTLP